MKVVIAIDSLKGCLTSRQANEAAREAVLQRWPDTDVTCLPVSDGGEGFLDAIEGTGNYQRITLRVLDPLRRPIEAQYLMCGHHAAIEMAQASGIALLKPEERDPLCATSYGTGQLIADALRRGATDIIVGLGGSATSDCGKGMLESMAPLMSPRKGGGMPFPLSSPVQALDIPLPIMGEDGRELSIVLATDVTNPLLGSQGAAHTFARQKAAPDMTPAQLDAIVEELESRASAFAAESAARLGHDLSREAGAGAAGGVGYALMQYLGARRVSGIDYVLNLSNFDRLVCDADLVITGEGRADSQTLMGKVPMGILQHTRDLFASRHSLPASSPKPSAPKVILLAGQVHDRDALLRAGFAHVVPITPTDMPLSVALQPQVARRNIIETIRHISL